MRSDIERYLAGRPVHAVAPPAPPPTYPPTDEAATVVGAGAVPPEEPSRRSRTVLFVLLAILLVALIAGAAYLLPRMFESPPDDVQVPNLVGKTEDEARRLIGNAGLAVGDRTFENSETTKKNVVLRQDPSADDFVAPDTAIDFVVSLGKPQVEVPAVVGQQRNAARDVIENAGLRVKFEERESDEPTGRVLATDPQQGEQVAKGTIVTVIYSDGPEEIPDVVGMKQREAEETLREAGFEPDVVTSDETTEPKGTVIKQSPPAGQTGQEGSIVTIVVSSFQEPSEPPSPTDTSTTSPSPTPTTLTPSP